MIVAQPNFDIVHLTPVEESRTSMAVGDSVHLDETFPGGHSATRSLLDTRGSTVTTSQRIAGCRFVAVADESFFGSR
jgi:hypothetical protein